MNTIKSLIILLTLLYNTASFAQNTYIFSGHITDEKGEALIGAHVALHELQKFTQTDRQGDFRIENLPEGEYHVHISFLGYRCVHHQKIRISGKDIHRTYRMQPDNAEMEEIIINADRAYKRRMESSLAVETADEDFIKSNSKGSLMKSLESIPGISAGAIGQGFSKPVIRGLSSNRVALSENGIKQEGQQWGADHGPEIDRFAVERVEIIKGPASLIYGSDAVGGLIRIQPAAVAEKHSSESGLLFIGKSLNNLYGISALNKFRKEDWYYSVRATYTDFGDYKVPADSFFYNRFRLPIENGILKNTAGRERNISFTSGVLKKHFKSSLSFSNVYSKMGFFPGSHGIPDARSLAHDGSYRNIDLPFQMVNHIKLISNTKIYLPAGSFDIDLAYQNNFRQEWSEFHTHYPAQDPPDDNTDLELQFYLHTISGNFAYKQIFDNSELQLGLNTQLQQNRIDGYMFLLPEYERKSAGLFVHNKYTVNSNFTLSGGLRFDYGSMHIRSHFSEYAERYKSPDFKGDFYDFTWALGMSYRLSESLNFKSNVGKSFRMPNAVELSANGIHHGSFRYEVGDTAITSEYSYQLDVGLYFKSEKWRFEFSPFINYFPNFIFLSPSGSYLHPSGEQIREADAGQVWQYRQSEAFRAGSELFIKYRLLPNLHVSTGGQYVYATDFSYPIPFTPPFSLHSQLEYSVGGLGNILQKTVFRLSSEYSAAQNRNARNELPTPAYHLLDASLSSKLNIFKYKAELSFQVHNIFDRRYFNHLSFYRLIELPEAGRNYQLILEFRF